MDTASEEEEYAESRGYSPVRGENAQRNSQLFEKQAIFGNVLYVSVWSSFDKMEKSFLGKNR